MPTTVEIILPTDRTAEAVKALRRLDLLSLRLHPGVVVHPAGDLLTVQVTNRDLHRVMEIADRWGAGRDEAISLSTSRPASLVSAGRADDVVQDSDTATAEEVELAIGEESTMTAGKLVIMLVAGTFAGLGLATGTLHLVIGAMVVAPGFEPFSRIALGLANGSRARRRGLVDVGKGYSALLVGGAVSGVLCAVFGVRWLDAGAGSYLSAGALQQYFSAITWVSVTVGVLAGAAGALLLVVDRRVLTAGVMIALGLIPAFALTGMALVAGEFELAGRAAQRGALDAVAVTVASSVVFWLHRRSMRRCSRL